VQQYHGRTVTLDGIDDLGVITVKALHGKDEHLNRQGYRGPRSKSYDFGALTKDYVTGCGVTTTGFVSGSSGITIQASR
jgi:hypothetical protein